MSQTPRLPSPVYHPQVFVVNSLDQAMSIVVTPEPGTTTEERWEKETRYLVDDIGKMYRPSERQLRSRLRLRPWPRCKGPDRKIRLSGGGRRFQPIHAPLGAGICFVRTFHGLVAAGPGENDDQRLSRYPRHLLLGHSTCRRASCHHSIDRQCHATGCASLSVESNRSMRSYGPRVGQ
jgi:hypothetical protein